MVVEQTRGNEARTKRKRDANSACNKYSYYSGVESGYSIGDDSLCELLERVDRTRQLRFRCSSIQAKQEERV